MLVGLVRHLIATGDATNPEQAFRLLEEPAVAVRVFRTSERGAQPPSE
jgi:hypothetical protein